MAGRDDIETIGNRKIGGRGLGNWYSLESEIDIGREYSQEIESTREACRRSSGCGIC